MFKRFALGAKPATGFLLTIAALAAGSSAAQARTTPTVPAPAAAATAVPMQDATPGELRPATTPLLQLTPAPAATALQPVAQPGRAAILSPAPRAVAGTTPPSGAATVRPAITQAGLWPLVWAKMQTSPVLDNQEECIAVAVYHEARGEPLPGQLAVAEVIMNRAASGRYPADWCSVVKQPWQFSFVNPRTGRYPAVNRSSTSWSYAQAITRIAVTAAADALPSDVLWYHADYVAPSWGRRLAKVEKIGAHIFYRAS